MILVMLRRATLKAAGTSAIGGQPPASFVCPPQTQKKPIHPDGGEPKGAELATWLADAVEESGQQSGRDQGTKGDENQCHRPQTSGALFGSKGATANSRDD